ncbi:phosphoinositide phospholipase C 4-like [Dorcoceras hygrometricum]|uniref:Phosphoinositide phospholipase C 4-like n=1 Tax=Dorcoceras hygrometricum TaxID=472368 RepID=A0A2Z7AYE6_9LAMI|nr:phosphoinositide phospholipase C 4-like [Dorcoceras hygrometricum]
MPSSYYTNTLHVIFESILAMDDPGMVSMFQALMASGLEGFLSCPAVIYEAALVDFFENASVRDGLSELSEIPKDLLFDTRSIVSLSGEPVKAGSFDALTMEKFMMLTAIICEVKIKWNRVLFNILKDMATAGSRQAKGYAIQISLMLENVPNLELGESSEFPSSKILTDKTVHRYIVLNEKAGAEGAADAPQIKKAPNKQAASKKRPAAAAVGEPVLKKKRTMKKKSGSSQEKLEIVAVAQEAVPIQIIEPISACTSPVEVAAATGEQEPAVDHMDEQMAQPTADVETIFEEFDEPAVEGTAEEIRLPSTDDDVDDIIEKVLAETAHIEADEKDHGVGTSDVGDQPAGTADDSVPWFDLPYEVLIAHDSERLFETASDTEDEEMEIIHIGDQQLQTVDSADYFVEKPVEETETEADEYLGEVSSSRPQPLPDDKNRGSGNTGGDNVRTTDIVDRFSGSMSREGQNRGSSGGRSSSGNRSGSSK